MKNDLYKDGYGKWSGNPKGHAPDYTLCCEEVWERNMRWSRAYQCSKKRGHGPDGAYCKQHDPDVVKARQEKSEKRAREKINKERYKLYGRTFFDALEKIANGHNDARGLAQEVIADFKEGEW